jgi:hypothetical protein
MANVPAPLDGRGRRNIAINQPGGGAMRPRFLLSTALIAALLGGLLEQAGAGERKYTNVIKIIEATYGGNCEGVAKGNATQFLASACDNSRLCNYRVYYRQLGGDPAAGCEKDFRVLYTCGRTAKPNTCEVAAEAGMGGEDGYPNQFCLLHCTKTGRFTPPGAHAAQARRKIGGFGANDAAAATTASIRAGAEPMP